MGIRQKKRYLVRFYRENTTSRAFKSYNTGRKTIDVSDKTCRSSPRQVATPIVRTIISTLLSVACAGISDREARIVTGYSNNTRDRNPRSFFYAPGPTMRF